MLSLPAALLALLPAAAPPPAPPPVIPPARPAIPLPARLLGPATMGGRVTSVAVVEGKPAIQYVGSAGGGVWKTEDNGLSWRHVFPGRPNPSIGAVAVAPGDPAVVWVGTGEANARNSVSWGNGVFRSTDAGKTWVPCGLAGSHHIGRIVVHPRDPAVAWVAALGHLWGPSAERGVFKTVDGGKTWQHSLALDAETGCVDLASDPADPQTLYAAAYRVRRDGFAGGNPEVQFGPRAGLYRTRDGGRTWERMLQGLPGGPQFGRCGLAVSRSDPRVLFAVVQTDRTDISKVAGQAPGPGADPASGGIFRSADRGATWEKVNSLCPRPFYFGQIRIDPRDPNRIYVLGIPLYASQDGGRTFRSDAGRGVHVDHHDLWIDPADPDRLVLGNDGGLYHSTNRAAAWTAVHNLPISQFYGVAVDTRTPYRVYGGLQDNGSWGGPSCTDSPAGVLNADWFRVLGADGFQCAVDPTDPDTVYAEGQYGRLSRVNVRTKQARAIRPRSAGAKAPAYRFNWNAPLVLSPHDPKTLFYGANVVFRSGDRGETWQVISPDLTRPPAGAVAGTAHTLSALAQSPVQPSVLWAGSDDGAVHVSRDAGKTWLDVGAAVPGAPAARWVTRLEPSQAEPGTCWLAFTRHRQDDRAPYLYRTDDFGQTWKSLAAGLPPGGPVLVVRADALNRDLLYVGTEFGLFASLDRGATWRPLGADLPPCAVHDLVVHPRDRELVAGTHGLGIFVLDVAPLQELTAKVQAQPAHLCAVRPVTLREARPAPAVPPRTYAAPNPTDDVVVHYWLARAGGEVTLRLLDRAGKPVVDLPATSLAGLNRVSWDPRRGRKPLPAGEYVVELRAAAALGVARLSVKSEK